MQPSGLLRNMRNVVHNYTEVEIKVREATSNDPWGPRYGTSKNSRNASINNKLVYHGRDLGHDVSGATLPRDHGDAMETLVRSWQELASRVQIADVIR